MSKADIVLVAVNAFLGGSNIVAFIVLWTLRLTIAEKTQGGGYKQSTGGGYKQSTYSFSWLNLTIGLLCTAWVVWMVVAYGGM